jgi:hypothetical protein
MGARHKQEARINWQRIQVSKPERYGEKSNQLL